MTREFVLERRVGASVEDTWAAFTGIIPPSLSQVGGEFVFKFDEWELTERTLELDPPRRRVYGMVAGAPVHSYVGTTELHADGDDCLLRWTVVADPAVAPEIFDVFFARAELVVTRGINMILDGVQKLSR